MPQPVEYTFNASALGVGGYYVSGGETVQIPSIASVALAPNGGTGESVVENYNQHGITFKTAKSAVRGFESKPGVYTTRSEIEIEELSVFNRVYVKRLSAVVMSERDTNVAPGSADEADFRVDATYDGVQIDGCVVTPEIDRAACTAPYAAHHASYGTPGPSVYRGDSIRRSVVTNLPASGESVAPESERPYVLNVPGFGRIHFGELFVKRGRRRVNLLRFEFDSSGTIVQEGVTSMQAFTPESGMLAVGCPDGNGEPIWPRQ